MIPFAIIAGITAAAGAVGTYGAVKSAKGQKAALNAQADDARRNAQIAGINEAAILKMGDINAEAILGTADLNASIAQRVAEFQGRSTMALAGIKADSITGIADLNARAATDIASINTGLKKQIGEANLQLADGNYNLMMDVAEFNAEMAERDAQDALDVGRRAEQSSRLQTANIKSTQIARLAANGVALDEGSSLRIMTATDWAGETDANTLHANAVRQAMGIRSQAAVDMSQARLQGLALKADAMGAKLAVDAEIMRETTEAGMFSINSRMQGEMDAFSTRQTAAIITMQARDEADTYAIQQRSGAALSALDVRTQAKFNAMDARIQGQNYTNQGRGLSVAAAGISPTLVGAGGLLDTAASVAGKWYSHSKAS